MPFLSGYSARMKHDERSTGKRRTAGQDRADEVAAMSGRVRRLRAECFLISFFLNIPNKVQFFFILTFSTIPKINRKGKICCGGNIPRNYIWEVRSKASTPEMTKKPFKAFLHRKADYLPCCYGSTAASKEASSIFDLDKSARFNLWINRCVILHFFSSGGVRNPNADYIPFPCVFCVIGMRIKSLFCAC